MECEVEIIENLPLPDTSAGRSIGVHVSSIIRGIAIESGFLKQEVLEDLRLIDVRDMSDIGIVAQLRIHAGMAWENWYIPNCLPNVINHPGEMQVNGIYMTHDGESLDVIITDNRPTYAIKIHEVKYTYKSTKTVGNMEPDNRKNFMWLAQTKSYCKGAGTKFADLHAYFVNGDYSWPQSPELRIFHLSFTDEEIEDNWTLMREYRDLRLSIEGEQYGI